MNISNRQQSQALRMEAGSCFFISLKKHDHSDSLTAKQVYALQYFSLIILILYICRNAQSITMVTNAQGTLVAGDIDNTGALNMRYKPYGEVNRTNSTGADIFRYKYTAQEDDQETGLYFYKSRYYDPYIGRFMQSDSVTNTASLTGQDLYQYVDGNPVMYRDATGNSTDYSHMFGQIIKGILKVGDYKNFTTQNVAGAMKWAGTSMGNTAKWMSKGLKNAGTTYNNFVYGTHHNADFFERNGKEINEMGKILGGIVAFGVGAVLVGLALTLTSALFLEGIKLIVVGIAFAIYSIAYVWNVNPIWLIYNLMTLQQY